MGKVKDATLNRIAGKLRRKLKPELLLLFGSRARRDHLRTSDYDILVVSQKFEGLDFHQRILLVTDVAGSAGEIEPICLTPREFKERRKRLDIVGVALKEGTPI